MSSRLAILRISCVTFIVFAAHVADAWGGHRFHHFKLKGPLTVTETQCTPNLCLNLSSSDLVDKKNGLVYQFTGTGEINLSTCQPANGENCCQLTENGVVQLTASDTVSEGVVGHACQNDLNTTATLRGVLTITGGTGFYAGASGSGKLHATLDPQTGDGTIVFKGKIKR